MRKNSKNLGKILDSPDFTTVFNDGNIYVILLSECNKRFHPTECALLMILSAAKGRKNELRRTT